MHDIEFFPIPRASLEEVVELPEPEVQIITVTEIIYRQAYRLVWLVGFLMFILGVALGKVL